RPRPAGRPGAGDVRRRPPGRLAGPRPGAAGRRPPDPPARAVRRSDAASRGPGAGLRRHAVRPTPPVFSRPPPCCTAAGSPRDSTPQAMTDAPHDSTAVRFDAVRLDRGGRTILADIDLSLPRG